MSEVIIIGGGFAGLAAGVALAGAGRRVRVLERTPHLGGRARSLLHAPTGDMVDNGQHLLMGCYHSTLRFLKEIGTLDQIALQPKLKMQFVESGGNVTTLECPNLPAPWHVLTGVLRSNAFTWSEKQEISRLGRAVQKRGSDAAELDSLTVEEWLTQLGQSENLKRGFWDLLSIAALNEDPRRASAAMFARVLKLALFTSARDSCLALPRAGLSECYAGAAMDYIESHGGKVEFGRRVDSLLVSDGTCRGVRFTSGELAEADAVLSAVPWNEFVGLAPADWLRAEPYFTNILALRPAPIISINLWLDRAITDLEFAGLRGTTIQWIFNRAKVASTDGQCYSLVLSGAHELVAKSKDDLLKTALADLAKLFPEARSAQVLHSLVIKERFATFSPCVGVDALRPSARSPIRGLYLAGDWTATGLPATIEGAVQSGYTAAEHILNQS
jgi:hydroxysqualene dehydroxylase